MTENSRILSSSTEDVWEEVDVMVEYSVFSGAYGGELILEEEFRDREHRLTCTVERHTHGNSSAHTHRSIPKFNPEYLLLL